MKTVTIQEVIGWRPCSEYTPKRLSELFAGRESMTALDALELNIPAEDKLWAVLRTEAIDESILHEFACRCAEEALKLVANPDPRSIAAIEAKRKWSCGQITKSELSAAETAAWGAAKAAAWAAWSAAWAADGDAAWAAACAAACAARDAARAARAARDARDARIKQVEILKELLIGG